jgi:hypothetical protein
MEARDRVGGTLPAARAGQISRTQVSPRCSPLRRWQGGGWTRPGQKRGAARFCRFMAPKIYAEAAGSIR